MKIGAKAQKGAARAAAIRPRGVDCGVRELLGAGVTSFLDHRATPRYAWALGEATLFWLMFPCRCSIVDVSVLLSIDPPRDGPPCCPSRYAFPS